MPFGFVPPVLLHNSLLSMGVNVSGSLTLPKRECTTIPKGIQVETFDVLGGFMIMEGAWGYLPRQQLT